MSTFDLLPSFGMTTSMTRKQLKEVLLATNGWVVSNGYACDVKSKNLGAGVYKVWLQRRG